MLRADNKEVEGDGGGEGVEHNYENVQMCKYANMQMCKCANLLCGPLFSSVYLCDSSFCHTEKHGDKR
jgi:hypothetical protein